MNESEKLYQKVMQRVAEEEGIPYKTVEKVYRAYWKAIREHITSIPLKQDLSEEGFRKLKPNVNIPSIGKLYVDYGRYKIINRAFKNKINKEKHDTHKED